MILVFFQFHRGKAVRKIVPIFTQGIGHIYIFPNDPSPQDYITKCDYMHDYTKIGKIIYSLKSYSSIHRKLGIQKHRIHQNEP